MKDEIDILRAKEEARRARVKAQNESAKERWETISCRVPKGTKDVFRKHGISLNGIINELLASEIERLEEVKPLTDPWQDLTPAGDPLARVSAVPASVPAPSLEELQEMLNAKREERTQLPEEIRRPEPEEIEEEPAPPEPVSVTDTPGLSIRELAERAKQTVREEAEKREAARQKSEAESAVAEMLKNRS